MLLACNRDALREFLVNSPLTEEACMVLYRLPKLWRLWTALQEHISLPPMTLPSLVSIALEYEHGVDCLRGFGGATLRNLKQVTFCPKGTARITNFLEEFQRVALATSTQKTLSRFIFRTLQAWNPNYSALLVFKQLTELEIDFSCRFDCSSRVDDDILSLAEAMPKLKILQLGRAPCRSPTGVTFKGLVVLACRCSQLSKLRVHFQAHGSAEATNSAEPPSTSEHVAVIPHTNCSLTDLQVGETPIPQRVTLAVALTLLQVFPQILNVEYTNPHWKGVVDTIKLFKRIGGHVHHASKTHLPRFR